MVWFWSVCNSVSSGQGGADIVRLYRCSATGGARATAGHMLAQALVVTLRRYGQGQGCNTAAAWLGLMEMPGGVAAQAWLP